MKTIIIILLLSATISAYGNDNVRAVMGEASGEGFTGMKAIACAIRNRGTLKGVYGLRAKHIDKEPKRVWDMAQKAWEESAKEDITNGATHWGSKIVDKEWIKKMERSGFVKTFEYKNQAFYREVKHEKKAIR